MIALVMAGGKGKRMKINDEKLLLKYIEPTILHVISALRSSNKFSKILAVTSSNSPKTKELLQKNGIEIMETSGTGFVEDLNSVLQTLNDNVFVTPGDLPLIDEKIISQLLENTPLENFWTSFLVTANFLKSLGLNSLFSINFQGTKCHYTGISLVNAKKITDLESVKENYLIFDDKRIAFNLNTKEDYELLKISGNLSAK